MNLDKYTQKSQEALLGAQNLAEELNHPSIEPAHLLLALLRQEDGVVPALVTKVAGVRLPGPAPADQQQHLVAGVGDRVDRLGQHRGGAGEREGDELGGRDAQVRRQRGDDRPATGLSGHSAPLSARLHDLSAGTVAQVGHVR